MSRIELWSVSLFILFSGKINLPPSGIHRGHCTVMSLLEGAYRLSVDEVKESKLLPRIPCQTISYGDVEKLLSIIGGDQVPEE